MSTVTEAVVDQKSVHSLSSDMECICIELEMAQALLTVYGEHMESEVSTLKSDECWTVECFLRRQDMGLALLGAIEDKLRQILEQMKQATSKGFEICRIDKQAQHTDTAD